METIIEPVDPRLIEAELTSERFLRHTNKGNNDIYVVDAFCAPNTMREIAVCARLHSAMQVEAPARLATLMSLTQCRSRVGNS